MLFNYSGFIPISLRKLKAKPDRILVTKENPPCPICLTGARTKLNQRFTSSLGPLIWLPGHRDTYSFALLYCAHTANTLKGKRFSFTRLHKVDELIAKKYHTFSEREFNDLAVAHTILPEGFCTSHLVKSQFKQITSANIGDKVRIISVNNLSLESACKIKAVNNDSNMSEHNLEFRNLIQLDYRGTPGDSGSPVLSAENEIIGLIVRTDEYGYSYCNKLFDAKFLLKSLLAKSYMKSELNEIYLIS